MLGGLDKDGKERGGLGREGKGQVVRGRGQVGGEGKRWEWEGRGGKLVHLL